MSAEEKPDVPAVDGCGCGNDKKQSFGCGSALLGVALILFVLVFVGIGPEGLGTFCDVPALAILLLLVCGGWLITPGFSASRRSLKTLLRNQAQTPEEARQAKDFCLCGIGYALAGAPLGFLIGAINIVSGRIFEPEALTNGATIMLTILFYAAALIFLLLALYFIARRLVRRQEASARDATA